MTLRLTLEIVPFGEEDKKHTIDVINISNVTRQGSNGKTGYIGYNNEHEGEYVVEHNHYKEYTDDTPRVRHDRDAGALVLAKTALEKIINEQFNNPY